MPFRPGCHCPFHRSYRRPLVASAVTGVARCSVWSSLFFSFCHPSRHIASAFPHVQPSSLFGPSPRVSTAGAYCWQSIVTPRLPWWFFRYAPLMVFVEGAGLEPAMSYAFFAAYPRLLSIFGGLFPCSCLRHSAILPCPVCCYVIATFFATFGAFIIPFSLPSRINLLI